MADEASATNAAHPVGEPTAWAKPDAHLLCGNCEQKMVAAKNAATPR